MANASLLIPSISAALSILVVFFPCVAWEDTAASCCSCPFEQLPTGQGYHPPTQSSYLAGSRHCHYHRFSVCVKRGKRPMQRNEKREKVGSCQSKSVMEKPEGTQEERKRERSWQRVLTCLHFCLFCFCFPTSAFLPFPPLLPLIPFCYHPGFTSHPACGPTVRLLCQNQCLWVQKGIFYPPGWQQAVFSGH